MDSNRFTASHGRYRQVALFLLWVSLFVMGIRTVMIVVNPLLVDSALGYAWVSDRIHHFHLGLLVLLAGYGVYRKQRSLFLVFLAFGLALIFEEYLVIIYELGISVPYNYLSRTDNVVVYGISGIGVLLALFEKMKR